MEATFIALCREHGLTNVGTLLQHSFSDHLTVFLHWGDGDDAGCVSGGGKTFDEALKRALDEMAAVRVGEAA